MKKFKAFGLSFVWMLLTVFFGLFKLWADSLLSYITNKKVDFNNYFIDGILLWFLTSIIAAVLVDFWMSRKRFNKIAEMLLMGLFPLILFVTSVFTLYGMNKEPIGNIENLKTVQFGLFFATILYVIIAKTIQFHQDRARFI